MNIEKWQNIVGMIKDQFKVEDEGKEELDDVPNGTIEFIIFQGPLGKMRLEYTVKPVVLDKKTIGSRRIGSETTVEYIYSEDEMSQTFKAYKWDDDRDDWVEIEQERLGAFTA
ncbi:hypothetical protein COT99_01995 [Candidatus Falkowbacteria bacterium CG10_big_fil_rev_8_21_14_0_10_43_10]|uniref:Uncharacterized protein n=1 Tax=Candidatus Falkowbacteria bacterium CG10_big_fil_rev_8_21_14_0_10_43_10 TaxID=1974567 RepID=A0A2H0V288_9BACT|nr:MAG: hypothetical protein COT99_01995 [Candidatus Falkowbacteria bacterium CG10_big_fil_rev_8_21_14_0_10_43_10]